MTRIHLKKKDVVKSSAKGISIELDHELPVAILDVPQEPGICEYIKEVLGRVKEAERIVRDDDEAYPEEEVNVMMKGTRMTLTREAVIDEATRRGGIVVDDQFYDAQVGRRAQHVNTKKDQEILPSSAQ
ncbi:hypothetical protein Dimus_024682 [Dionaea muscipula]